MIPRQGKIPDLGGVVRVIFYYWRLRKRWVSASKIHFNKIKFYGRVMNAKTANYVIILAGVILLLVGIMNQVQVYSIWNYISVIAGIIVIFLGIWGLKSLSWVARHT